MIYYYYINIPVKYCVQLFKFLMILKFVVKYVYLNHFF